MHKCYLQPQSLVNHKLFSAEKTVASIAQARYDIAVIVEMIIKRRNEYIHIGMRFLHRLYAFGSSDKVHQLYPAAAADTQAKSPFALFAGTIIWKYRR